MTISLKFKVIVIICICSILFVISCKKESETRPPFVITNDVSSITHKNAVSGGNVTDSGSATVVMRGVCWNTSTNPNVNHNKTIESGDLGPFVSTLSNLTAGTAYFVRAYAVNEYGASYGNEVSFTTIPVSGAILITTPPKPMTLTSAISGGKITSDGGGLIIARGICWGQSTNPSIADFHTSNGGGEGSFTSILTNLLTNTLYYVRAYATNSAGTVYGDQHSFTIQLTSPIYISSLVEDATPDIIELTFSQPLVNITPADTSFIVQYNNVKWLNLPIVSISISGSKVFLIMYNGSQILFDHIVTVSYKKPSINPLQISSGEHVPSFTAQVVTNKVNPRNSEIIFNPNLTYGSVRDADGNTYKTIQIGTQTWMAENLRTTRFNDGTEIVYVTDSAGWAYNLKPVHCYYDDGQKTYGNVYGALYNWHTVNTGLLCPTGWHVPTEKDWSILTAFLGETSSASKLRETGTSHWYKTLDIATNETGFTALPGGSRYSDGSFWPCWDIIGYTGEYWTADQSGDFWKKSRIIFGASAVVQSQAHLSEGLSVRCLKN